MTKGSGAKKVNAKKVAKAVEDKTFGMKNKGGKKSQAMAKQMAASIGGSMRKNNPSKDQPQSKKAIKAERDAEMERLGLNRTVPTSKKSEQPIASSSAGPDIIEHEEITDGRLLEEKIEEMRRSLPEKDKLTPVTPETFAVWYAKKKKEKAEKQAKKASKREKDIALGRVAMTGRELYDRKRNVFVDDAHADEDAYTRDDEEIATFVASLEEQMRMDAEVNGVEFDEAKFKEERDRILAGIKADRAKLRAGGGLVAKKTSSAVVPVAEDSSSAPPMDALDTTELAEAIDESLFNADELPDDEEEEEDAEAEE